VTRTPGAHRLQSTQRRSAEPEPDGDRLVSAAVFGAVARGTVGPESDSDILPVADPLPPRFKTPNELADASPLFHDMTEALCILHDPQHVLRDSLQRPRQRLQELGARRIRSAGEEFSL